MINREYETHRIPYQFFSYFETLMVEIHSCTGLPEVGGKHLEISGVPRRSLHFQLQNYSLNEGDVAKWFAKHISTKGTILPNLSCFRSEEGKILCSGNRTDTRGLVLAIPIMFTLNVPDSTEP